jgi:prepilin-type processing-associated H-X9-DG protein/prepilin-type N-terminal cleavage/methylation domain-containing protein
MSRKAGFTLTEAMVAMAIVSIIAALCFPAFQKMQERQKAARCVANLRTTAALLHVLAQERNGVISVFREGGGAFDVRWNKQLRELIDAPLETSPPAAVLSCPAMPDGNSNWYCYGMFMINPPGRIVSGDGYKAYEVRLGEIEKPSTTPMFADSVDPGNGKQIFRIVSKNTASSGGVHLRHDNRANMVFYDGHVEGVGNERLAELGFSQALGSGLGTVTLP